MKEFYTKPNTEIELFYAFNVISTSDTDDSKREPIELPDL